jgi:hypothetical protein
MSDGSGDVRWLTYEEIAVAFGVTRESARQLVIRKRWRRRKGNEDAKARIGVPVDAIQARTSEPPSDATSASPSEDTSGQTGHAPSDVTSPLRVLTRHIERLERERDGLTTGLAAMEAERDEERRRVIDLTVEAAIASALRVTVEVLKETVATEKQRVIELRHERDHWQEEAFRRLNVWERLFSRRR